MAAKDLETRIRELAAENNALYNRSERIASQIAINNLQGLYTFLWEANEYERIWNEVFAHNDPGVRCEIGDSGAYEGIESVKRFWMALENMEPKRGYMSFIIPMTAYIVLGKDRKTAKGMWTNLGPHADYTGISPERLTAYWFVGKYDNEYVKEDGKWKLRSLHNLVYIRSPYDKGWLSDPDCAKWQTPPDAYPDKYSVFAELYHPDGVFYPLPAPPEDY